MHTALSQNSAPSMWKTKEEFLASVQEVFPDAYIKEIKRMTTLTFTVAAIYDPKDGKKTGSIKTSTDKWVSYWPSDKHLFTVGETYSAVCDAREWNGNTYYTVKSPGKGGDVQSQGGGQSASPTHVANVSQPVGVSKDETITRLAIAKSCIESNQSQADADSWVAWVMKQPAPELAPQSPQQLETDTPESLDDEIPF